MDTPYESELSLSPGVNVCVGLRHAFLETTQVPEERPTLPTALHLSLNTSPWRWGHKFNISGGPDRRQQNRRVSVLHFQNEGSTAASVASPIDSFFLLKWRAIWTSKQVVHMVLELKQIVFPASMNYISWWLSVWMTHPSRRSWFLSLLSLRQTALSPALQQSRFQPAPAAAAAASPVLSHACLSAAKSVAVAVCEMTPDLQLPEQQRGDSQRCHIPPQIHR